MQQYVSYKPGFSPSTTFDNDLLEDRLTTEYPFSGPRKEDPLEEKMCFSDKKYILSSDGTVLHDLFPFPHPQIAILHASPLPQPTIDALQHPIIKSFLDQLATCHPRVQRVIFEFDPVENSDDTVSSLSRDLEDIELAGPGISNVQFRDSLDCVSPREMESHPVPVGHSRA